MAFSKFQQLIEPIMERETRRATDRLQQEITVIRAEAHAIGMFSSTRAFVPIYNAAIQASADVASSMRTAFQTAAVKHFGQRTPLFADESRAYFEQSARHAIHRLWGLAASSAPTMMNISMHQPTIDRFHEAAENEVKAEAVQLELALKEQQLTPDAVVTLVREVLAELKAATAQAAAPSTSSVQIAAIESEIAKEQPNKGRLVELLSGISSWTQGMANAGQAGEQLSKLIGLLS